MPIVTRFRPKRADELIGGSLYWIVKQRIAARQTILGFDEQRRRTGKTIIRLDPELVPVRATAEARPSGLALSRRRPMRRPISARATTAWRRCRPISPASWRVLALI